MTRLLSGLLICFSLTTVFSVQEASAQVDGKKTGLGIIVGEPTGISFKSWTGPTTAFDLGAAWSLGQYDALHLHGDYLWHNFNVFQDVDEGVLPVYYGIGARVVLAENDALIGARIPLGINYLFEEAPIGLFLEIAPTLNILPDTDFDVNGGVGVRYYF